MRKTLSVICALTLMLSFSNLAFASNGLDAKTEVAYIDGNVLDLSRAEEVKAEDFNQGLVSKVQQTDYVPYVDENGKWSCNDEIVDAIGEYCESHYDPESGAIYEEAFKQTDSDNIGIEIDEEAPQYKEKVQKYSINENVSVTITPDEVYIDEYVETPVVKMAASGAKASWKYKNVATRRTLIKKATFKGKTYSFKIYSVHTGGEVKYNGSKAKHSAAYYAYNLQEAYGSPFTFKQVAKQSEQISGTSWHYKYLGKVTGSISITTPIKLKITFKEKALGCQAITNKNGKVTKNYWPSL